MKFVSHFFEKPHGIEAPAPILALKNCRGLHCINLKSQPERYKEASHQFACQGLKLERFPAVLSKDVAHKITRKDGVNKIADGCLQSHINLYKSVLAEHTPDGTRPHVGVFEDDVVLLSTLPELDDYFARLPDDWDVVYLGGNYHFHPPKILNEHLIRPTYAFNTHAMLIRIDFLPRLIAALERKDAEVDVKMAQLQELREGNWYGFTTDFVWQHGRASIFNTSLWRHQLGLFHYSRTNRVIDQVYIKNHLP